MPLMILLLSRFTSARIAPAKSQKITLSGQISVQIRKVLLVGFAYCQRAFPYEHISGGLALLLSRTVF